MGIRRTMLTFSVLVFSALPAPAAREEILRPSQLNSRPEFYDGQEVVVRGYSFLAPEQNFLLDTRERGVYNRKKWAREEALTADDDKYCLTIINPNFLFEKAHDSWSLTHRMLTLRGKFVAHYFDTGVIDFGACPIAPGFIVEKVIKIEK
jgi:hypothetical protein